MPATMPSPEEVAAAFAAGGATVPPPDDTSSTPAPITPTPSTATSNLMPSPEEVANAFAAGGAKAPSSGLYDPSISQSPSAIVNYIRSRTGTPAPPGEDCGTGIEAMLGMPLGRGGVQSLRTNPSNQIKPDANGNVPDGTGVWFGGDSPGQRHYGITYTAGNGNQYLAEIRNSGPGTKYKFDSTRLRANVANERTHAGKGITYFKLPSTGVNAPTATPSNQDMPSPDEVAQSFASGKTSNAAAAPSNTQVTTPPIIPGTSVNDYLRQDMPAAMSPYAGANLADAVVRQNAPVVVPTGQQGYSAREKGLINPTPDPNTANQPGTNDWLQNDNAPTDWTHHPWTALVNAGSNAFKGIINTGDSIISAPQAAAADLERAIDPKHFYDPGTPEAKGTTRLQDLKRAWPDIGNMFGASLINNVVQATNGTAPPIDEQLRELYNKYPYDTVIGGAAMLAMLGHGELRAEHAVSEPEDLATNSKYNAGIDVPSANRARVGRAQTSAKPFAAPSITDIESEFSGNAPEAVRSLSEPEVVPPLSSEPHEIVPAAEPVPPLTPEASVVPPLRTAGPLLRDHPELVPTSEHVPFPAARAIGSGVEAPKPQPIEPISKTAPPATPVPESATVAQSVPPITAWKPLGNDMYAAPGGFFINSQEGGGGFEISGPQGKIGDGFKTPGEAIATASEPRPSPASTSPVPAPITEPPVSTPQPVEADAQTARETPPSAPVAEPSERVPVVPVEAAHETPPTVMPPESTKATTGEPTGEEAPTPKKKTKLLASINPGKISNPDNLPQDELLDFYNRRATEIGKQEPLTREDRRAQSRALGLTPEGLNRTPVGWKPSATNSAVWVDAVRDADAAARQTKQRAQISYKLDPTEANKAELDKWTKIHEGDASVRSALQESAAKNKAHPSVENKKAFDDLNDQYNGTAGRRAKLARESGQALEAHKSDDDPWTAAKEGDLFRPEPKGKTRTSKRMSPGERVQQPNFGKAATHYTEAKSNEGLAYIDKLFQKVKPEDRADCQA